MNILVLNRGSSTLKCSLYAFSQLPDEVKRPIKESKIEWESKEEAQGLPVEKKVEVLLHGQKIDCVGHRIVQGGDKYRESILITETAKKELYALADLAPLHNKANLQGVDMIERLLPGVPQVAVFDTAFHRTLPEAAAVYPGPYEWFAKGIRRYGFHGISFQYCSRRSAQLFGYTPERMVICHLGSGASLCALSNGKSVDTTMGFTPLEGLMMDTRSGSVDPGILLHLLEQGQTAKQLSEQLYEQSGLLGLSGTTSDMRSILKRASDNDARAQLALEVYLHRLTSMIGAMVASLRGLDVLIFTGGIGENASLIRQETCRRLAFLGIDLVQEKEELKEDVLVSSSSSRVKVLILHTQEAFEIARECWTVAQG